MVAFLTHEEILRRAPGALATGPSDRLSDRYNFVSTADLIDEFETLGYGVVSAQQGRSYKRSPDNKKHTLRLRAFEDEPINDPRGGVAYPEIVLINSSDGSSSLRLAAGLFAIVCSNGLVTQTVDMGSYRSRHVALDYTRLSETVSLIDEYFAANAQKVAEMGGMQLNSLQRMSLAHEAINARWGADSGIVSPEVLTPRREQDNGHDLWTTFNVVQENVIRGGFKSEARPRAIRELTNLDAVNRVNVNLWEQAEQMLLSA